MNVPQSGWVEYGVDLNLKVEMAFRNRKSHLSSCGLLCKSTNSKLNPWQTGDVNPVSFEDANVSLVIFPLRLFQLDKKRKFVQHPPV